VAVAGLLLGTGACSSTGDTIEVWQHVFGLRDVCIPATADATRYLISFGNIELTSGHTLEAIEADITGDPPPDLQIMVGGDGVLAGDVVALGPDMELLDPTRSEITGPRIWPLVFVLTATDQEAAFHVAHVDLVINGQRYRTDEIFDAVVGAGNC
jgi:hypothetical protein